MAEKDIQKIMRKLLGGQGMERDIQEKNAINTLKEYEPDIFSEENINVFRLNKIFARLSGITYTQELCRSFVLNIHSYIEDYIEGIIVARIGLNPDSDNFKEVFGLIAFSKKLNILRKWRILDKADSDVLESINKTRVKYAHLKRKLTPNDFSYKERKISYLVLSEMAEDFVSIYGKLKKEWDKIIRKEAVRRLIREKV